MDLVQRTRDACDQLGRYGGAVATPELADVLDALTDLNDDLCHGRDPLIIAKGITNIKTLLDKIRG